MFPQDATLLIPQQQPFVMVDELVLADENSAYTTFKIIAENPLFIKGVFQEGGLMENMAQTAAAHAGFVARQNNSPVKKGFIGSVSNFNVVQLPKQGDVLSTTVKIVDRVFEVTMIAAQVFCNDRMIASADMKIFIQD